MKKLLSILILLFIPASCFAWSLFEPKNIEDCILENMKGVSSDTAVQMIYKMCRDKFKDKEIVNSPKYKWTKHHDSKIGASYIDYPTVTKHGKIVTVMGMMDYHKVKIGKDGIQSSSAIVLLEFDCDKSTFRFWKGEDKTGHMGEGNTVASSGASEEKKTDIESYKELCSKD